MGAFQEFARAAMATGTKRGRRPVMNAQQFYPRGLERELQQKTVAEFMRIYGQFLEAALVGFSTFRDDQGDLSESQPVLSDAFKGELTSIEMRTDRKARENFSRQSEMIIGAPYYPPGSTEWILNDWHATFQDLCVSACAQQKTKIAVIVAGAKQAGWNKYQLEKAIEKQLPSQFKHRAELIARTELAKLNTAVTLETYRSSGVQYYKWLTTIDGRERESHALMNDRICSVTDGDVYFEQNPKQPLRPIEHRRTGDMYHGHPGTDFQCRCSMVMWDPAIDGDYEVKDSDLLEQREAEELAEKEAQERAEAERKAKEQAERENAAEALRTAKEAAKRAEAERQAAEKARQEAEENSRKLAEEARTARLEAAAVKRHAERSTVRIVALLGSIRETASENLARAEFPKEVWESENGVKISNRRIEKSRKSKNEKAKFEKEKEIASILVRGGHSVWLLPEEKTGEKNPDAIVDGLIYDFKQVKFSKIEHRFNDALEQTDNVVLRLEGDDFDIQRVFGKLRKHVRNRTGKLILILGEKIVVTDFNDIK